MNGFIRLTERHGDLSVLISIDHIVCVRDNRSDKLLANKRDWQWTAIRTENRSFEVKETEQEIVNLIKEVCK